MAQQWIELTEASTLLDLELNYLCELVINGIVKTTAEEDELLIDLETVPDLSISAETLNNKDYLQLKQRYKDLMVEYAWLKSENLKQNQILEDYNKKISQLTAIQEELKQIIKVQADTIRDLNGYPQPVQVPTMKNVAPAQKQSRTGLSLWMLFPLFGLLIPAGIDIARSYNLASIHDMIKLLSTNL